MNLSPEVTAYLHEIFVNEMAMYGVLILSGWLFAAVAVFVTKPSRKEADNAASPLPQPNWWLETFGPSSAWDSESWIYPSAA